jgi:NAD(P)-dependent dehydrogenase (short-subunit alcohol dehydrogenase family)
LNVENSVIIITGAAGGIGSATSYALAQQGAITILVDNQIDELERLTSAIIAQGYSAIAVPTDITQPAAVAYLVKTAIDQYGRVDILINIAGVGAGQYFMACTPEKLRETIDVNLLGSALCIHAVVPYMRQQKQGMIINIGSVAGELGLFGIYTATKFGIRGLSDTLRRELKHDNIAVVLVEPGFIDTRMTEEVKVRLPALRMPLPDVVAQAIVRVIRKPRNKIIVPWQYNVLVLLGKLLPWLVKIEPEEKILQRYGTP